MLRDAEEKRKSERKKNKKTKRNEVIGQRILRDWNIHVLDKSYIYIIYIRVIKFFLSPTSVYGCFSQQNDIIYSKARPSKTSKICVPIHMRIILPRGFFHSLKKKKKKIKEFYILLRKYSSKDFVQNNMIIFRRRVARTETEYHVYFVLKNI